MYIINALSAHFRADLRAHFINEHIHRNVQECAVRGCFAIASRTPLEFHASPDTALHYTNTSTLGKAIHTDNPRRDIARRVRRIISHASLSFEHYTYQTHKHTHR